MDEAKTPSSAEKNPQESTEARSTSQLGATLASPKAPEDTTIPDILKPLSNWKPTGSELEAIAALTARSLDTVTHLTEYEDDKANRILTAIAFVSAFAGFMFTLVPDRYPPIYAVGLISQGEWGGYLIVALYVLFGLYGIALLIGVLLVLIAVKPSFNVPEAWKQGSPRSFLFYKKILETKPEDWGKAFSERSSDDLRLEYAKNAIVETYLIAQKIPKKLSPLKTGVWFFFASTVILVLVLVFMGVLFATIPAQAHSSLDGNRHFAASNHGNG